MQFGRLWIFFFISFQPQGKKKTARMLEILPAMKNNLILIAINLKNSTLDNFKLTAYSKSRNSKN